MAITKFCFKKIIIYSRYLITTEPMNNVDEHYLIGNFQIVLFVRNVIVILITTYINAIIATIKHLLPVGLALRAPSCH